MTAKPYFTLLGFGIDKPLFWGAFVLLFTLIPVSHVAAQTCTLPPAGLVSWWTGDSDASDIQDGNDGVLMNGALAGVTGQVDGAFGFDGETEHVDIGIRPNLKFGSGAFTVDGWINPDSLAGTGGARWFVARHNTSDNAGFRFGIWRDDLVFRDRSTGADTFGSTIQTGVWTHIAVVREGTGVNQLKIYVNGALDTTGTSAGNFDDDSTFYIGRPGGSFVNIDYFDGRIDEVEIFNRALSAGEIQAIYKAGSDGKCKVLVDIDIKPGSDPNCFNVNGHGVIPVAILGSSTFDVTLVDLGSLKFGGLDVRVRGNKGPLCNLEDSDGDTILDLVCHFEDDAENWTVGDGNATLTGMLDGTSFGGTDSICVVP